MTTTASGPDSRDAVRTLRFDGAWFTVVGRRLTGEPTADPWHAIARGRRTAERLARPHVIDLPGETVVEEGQHRAAGTEPPWHSAPGDPYAGDRVRSAGERAARARARLAQLRAAAGTDLSTAEEASVWAREAQREAAVARARAAAVFESAALAHEAAADVHERLAASGVEPALHRARADTHRRAAEAEWRSSRSRLVRADDGNGGGR